MTNTRKMVTIAILSALSFVLMMVSFPLIPGAEFLKVDFSILPMLVTFILFDLKSSYGVL
ncbi:ECF transporter S component, partial [Streptococcus agalactiae]|nr:ECF transporter S component [Streptococcus agalactiae]MCC9983712.1 ECF transporter S component [Streptococcus agalactiae]